MPANLTNLTESGIDLADKYLANTDYTLIESYMTNDFLDSTITGGSGGLWAWGYNPSFGGTLGLGGPITHRSSPAQVGALTTWKTISSQQSISAAIKSDGTLWTWGGGAAYGAQGQGDASVYRSSPTQVGTLTNWRWVQAGGNFMVALKSDGTLWTWGKNYYGTLGQNDRTNRSSPVQVGSLTNWNNISAGRDHVLAVKTDGTLWAWGQNTQGHLGLGDTTKRSSPVQVGSLTNWKTVSAGIAHSLALKTDGTLWAWGQNTTGGLGLGNTTKRSSPVQVGSLTSWRFISAGAYSNSAAVRSDGTLWTWGANNYGQCGLGFSNPSYGQSSPTQVGTLTNWKQVNVAYRQIFATKTDGTLWAIGGKNQFGQLGLGDITYRSSPVQIGTVNTWKQVAGKGNATFATRS